MPTLTHYALYALGGLSECEKCAGAIATAVRVAMRTGEGMPTRTAVGMAPGRRRYSSRLPTQVEWWAMLTLRTNTCRIAEFIAINAALIAIRAALIAINAAFIVMKAALIAISGAFMLISVPLIVMGAAPMLIRAALMRMRIALTTREVPPTSMGALPALTAWLPTAAAMPPAAREAGERVSLRSRRAGIRVANPRT